jgi:NodT family efflux transporter outer membrane factor (OMF) lipoprotein
MFLRPNHKFERLRGFVGTIACLCLPGCAVGPDFHSPYMKMPQQYAAGAAVPGLQDKNKPVADAQKWWQSLKDDELNALIDRAIKANPDLEIALTRLQEARMEEAVVMGTALPEAEASGGAAKGTGSDLARGRVAGPLVAAEDTGKLQHITQIYGFDAGWELDLFGKYRRELEAAKYDTQAAVAARNDVLTSVIADVARAYMELRGLQMQQAVLLKNIAVEKQYTGIAQERYTHGITNELDVALTRRQLASLEAERAPLDSQIDAARYTIAVLLGQFPEDLAAELAKPALLPPLPEKIRNGAPLDLLRRRPDIREAEQELAASTARIGVATASLFPSISITGGAGFQGHCLISARLMPSSI